MSTHPDDLPAKPLTDDEIDLIRRKIADADPKELNDIFNKQTQVINAMLTMARKQTTEEDEIVELERLKRIINLTPSDERFIRVKDKVWAVRNHLINKNADFFLKRDYKGLIKKDHNQVLIETIISIIKDKYTELSTEEREQYWNKGLTLLNLVARYKKLVGEP